MSSIVFFAGLVFGGLVIGALTAALPAGVNATRGQPADVRLSMLFSVGSSLIIGFIIGTHTIAGLAFSLTVAALYVVAMSFRGTRSHGSTNASGVWTAGGDSGNCGGDSGGGGDGGCSGGA